MAEQQVERKMERKGLCLLPGRWWLVTLAGAAVLLLMTGFFLGQGVVANPGTVPGSEQDPLVTASWVEARLNTFAQALGQGPLPGVVRELEPAPVYRIVVVEAGQTMLMGEGTEFILRSGRARALVPVKGTGLANLTTGRNLIDGDPIERDHLILSPRDDGRGIVTVTQAIFLVRKNYRIV